MAAVLEAGQRPEWLEQSENAVREGEQSTSVQDIATRAPKTGRESGVAF